MFWIVTAHSTAATTEGNSSNTPSPMVLTTRPPRSATIGAAALRMLAHRLRRPSLILAHQAGIADNVDGHDCGKFPCFAHGILQARATAA
jgi:hypothetical protein